MFGSLVWKFKKKKGLVQVRKLLFKVLFLYKLPNVQNVKLTKQWVEECTDKGQGETDFFLKFCSSESWLICMGYSIITENLLGWYCHVKSVKDHFINGKDQSIQHIIDLTAIPSASIMPHQPILGSVHQAFYPHAVMVSPLLVMFN